MEILIINMQLRNFKGVRSLNVEFNQVTNITGDNATGKTTVFDAFTWLLFGKNSNDAKEFNIKTLDENNQPIRKLEHEVSATLDVDSREIKLRRVLREKWVKKRGSEIPEFTGHETEFFIDDVPLSQGEYNARVDIIIREDIAKLITNPLYFNGMKWQDRRVVLEAMAGAITNAEIAEGNDSFIKLLQQLGDANLIDFKKKITAAKKKIKDTLETIPTRIDEAQRSRPEPHDYTALTSAITVKKSEITAIESQMEDKVKSHDKEIQVRLADQDKLNNLKMELNKLEAEGKSTKSTAIATIDGRIRTVTAELTGDRSLMQTNISDISRNNTQITQLTSTSDRLRDDWHEENARTLVIDEHKFDCPTCKQQLPEDQRNNMRETLTANFNKDKANKLQELSLAGQNNQKKINDLKGIISQLEIANSAILARINTNDPVLSDLQNERENIVNQPEVESPEVSALKKRITEFSASLVEMPAINNDELKSKRAAINAEIDDLKIALGTKDLIAKLDTRINELSAEEKKLSQELADLERTEFTIDAFSKAKIETIESRINGKFSLVKFKMFEQQINGGEVECCECMVNGVPYSDVNTASKINAGIDIINALTEHYKVNAPIWIDNRESIIRLLSCRSQIINLIAVKDQPLTVSVEQMAEIAA
jgi:DNA repair exonuclease SbcCD ATPase subunit